MPDPDRDPERDRRTAPQYDNWPVERYDAYTEWPIERATPRDEGGTLAEVAEEYEQERDEEDVEWLGFVGAGTQGATPYLLGPGRSTIYRGEIDEAGERIVLREEGARAVESGESLGERIEEIGEEHGWAWLSSFARTYLQDDEPGDALTGAADGLEVRESEFMQRNLPASATADLGFSGSHTLVDASGQVYVIEREFTATTTDGSQVAIDIDEEYLIAEEPAENRRAGDAEIVEERQYSLEREVDTDTDGWKTTVETLLHEWHTHHVGWPPSEERDA